MLFLQKMLTKDRHQVMNNLMINQIKNFKRKFLTTFHDKKYKKKILHFKHTKD